MAYREALFLVAVGAEKIEQSESLAIGAAIDEGFVGEDGRSSYRTGCPDRIAQIGACQFLANTFEREKEECFILLDGTAGSAAKLLATKILQWLTIRGLRGQRFQTLKVE